MSADLSFFSLVASAGVLVKLVLLALLAASLGSWALIFRKHMFLKRARGQAHAFEAEFWSGRDLVTVYNRVNSTKTETQGLERIFHAGFREFARLRGQDGMDPQLVMAGTERAMRAALNYEVESLESSLSYLATVGSTSPYVGLFGTVWGIMNSFRSLGNVNQATLAMVAPGISEALVATAMGLFAAIPAVIAYNRYVDSAERLANRYQTFVEEFSTILQRQING